MVFAIKFGSPEEAAAEGSLLRDGWGSKINTAVSGDTVYVEGDDPQIEKIKDWYPDNPPKPVDPPEDVANILHGADESNTADKAWKVRVELDWEGNRAFTHVFIHAENAKEAGKNAAAFVEREYGGTNIAVTDTEEVIPAGKSESADEKLSYEKGHKNSKGEDAPWVIRGHKGGKVLASFATKGEAEAHLERMKRYSKTEGRFTEIKAAIKAAWSAAEVKWFRLDFREYQERLNVYPIASDNDGVGVNWGVLPERNLIVQYATAFRAGKSDDEREIPYKDLDELEKIFTDEFKSMDETLEIGAENGADIHPITESANEDAYMDALDAELDEIISAGAPAQQAAAADTKLQEEPAPEFTDAEYMGVMKAIDRLGSARVRAISQKAGVPLIKTGRILKGLVASGYAFGRKRGASNVFILTPEGKAEVPPPELNSKVPEMAKKLILSPVYSSASVEDRVDFINKMYDDVEKAGIGDIHWGREGSGDWLWASVKPSKRNYYLITITGDGTFGTVTFNDPDMDAPVRETATSHRDWSTAEFQKYLDERIPAIQAAYAKVKDYESKYYFYSFYNSKQNKNVKTKKEMLAVVEGTKGTGMTYYFRYGFAWKGASKSEVSYAEFREYCNHSQVDIEVNYNTMEAEVNEFSANDMY